MTSIIIPVKPLTTAKKRLADTLTPLQRANLMLAMLKDLLTVITSLKALNVWIVSNDTEVTNLARLFGVVAIPETVVGGYNAAVNTGLRYLAEKYTKEVNVAIIPADIPLADTKDLRNFTTPCSSKPATVRLVSSHDGFGTNGVFLSRIGLIKPAFGASSLVRHQKLCIANGITPVVLQNTSLALDVDTRIDLQALVTHNVFGATAAFLRSLPELTLVANHSSNDRLSLPLCH